MKCVFLQKKISQLYIIMFEDDILALFIKIEYTYRKQDIPVLLSVQLDECSQSEHIRVSST